MFHLKMIPAGCALTLCMIAVTFAGMAGPGDVGSTRERGATPAPEATTGAIACPEPLVNETFRSVTGICTPCRPIAEQINAQIEAISRIQKELNDAITEYNTLCPDFEERDDPRDADIPTDGPFYCGPDVTPIFMAALRRVHIRMKTIPDNEKGIYDASSPLGSFLMRNGTNVDQKPLLSSATGKGKCPTGPCAAKSRSNPNGDPAGQDCFMLWGQCVPQHVMNDIMFGFVADQVWAPEISQRIGGHFAQIMGGYKSDKWIDLDPATSTQSYFVGDELSEEMGDQQELDEAFAEEKIKGLMKTIRGDYPNIDKCEPCPDGGMIVEWKGDFSTRDWFLHDGKKQLPDGSIVDRTPGDQIDKDAEEDAEQLKRADRYEELKGIIAQLKASRAQAVAALARLRQALAECEATRCKPVEEGKKEIIIDGVELEEARTVDGTNPLDADGVKLHPEGGEVTPPPVAEPPVTQPPVVQPPVVQPPVTEPVTPPVEEKPVEVPPPVAPCEIQYLGGVSFHHIVQESPCPQSAGGVTVSDKAGHIMEVSNIRVSGSIAPKLRVVIERNGTANPFVRAEFNCSSPQNGTFTGTVTITVTDKATGHSKELSFPASGTVTGP